MRPCGRFAPSRNSVAIAMPFLLSSFMGSWNEPMTWPLWNDNGMRYEGLGRATGSSQALGCWQRQQMLVQSWLPQALRLTKSKPRGQLFDRFRAARRKAIDFKLVV